MNKETRSFLCILALVLTGIIIYINSLLNPFIWDDIFLIVTNLHIQDIGYIPRLFTENVYHQDMIGHFYRPILTATFALDYHNFGLDPFGYHATNILIHIFNALLIFYIITAIFGLRNLAFLTSMLFLVHPAQTEAVTYISGRADLLVTFFCLISLGLFLRFLSMAGIQRTLYYISAVVFFALGLMSKETAAIFPLLLILCEAYYENKRFKVKKLLKYLPFLCVIGVYFVFRSFILSGVKESLVVGNFAPLFNRLLTIPMVIFTYIKILFYPVGLHMERRDFFFNLPTSIFEFRVIASLTLLVLAGVLAWIYRKRSREAAFGFCWFIIALLPVLNIIPINSFVAEHWLYLPSIGFFLAVSSVIFRVADYKPARFYIFVALINIAVLLGALTIRQNYMWRNPVYFYKYTLRHSPDSARLHTNLGIEYFGLKMYREAENEYRQALRIEPSGTYTVYHYLNLASAYYWQGKEDEAFKTYEKAISLNPKLSLSYWYLGNIYSSKEDYIKAAENYRKAVEFTPTNASFWNDLGRAYLQAKMPGDASAAYKKALELYPYLLEARVNLGNAYARQGCLKEALEQYDIALKKAPDNAEIYYSIGNVIAQSGDLERARQYWEMALRKDPGFGKAKERLEDTGHRLIDNKRLM